MGRRASSAASHGHPLLLQINDQQSKELDQNQDEKDIGRDRVKLRFIEQLGEDFLELQRHDAEQPNTERYADHVLNGLQRAHDMQSQKLLKPGN